MLNAGTLKDLIIVKAVSFGFLQGNHARMNDFAQAIAEAVVEHLKNEAVITVSGGSSAGNYKIK